MQDAVLVDWLILRRARVVTTPSSARSTQNPTLITSIDGDYCFNDFWLTDRHTGSTGDNYAIRFSTAEPALI